MGNALPALKQRCDIVTDGARGAGVEEIVDRVVDSDLAELADGPERMAMFLQLGEGVDDDTWLHHLRAGDYSRWIADSVSDGVLARLVADVESDHVPPAAGTRARIRELILDRYPQAAEPDPETPAPS